MPPTTTGPLSAGRSRWRLSLRSVMVVIAFLALVLALVVQSARLARLEASAQRERARAAREAAVAHRAVDLYFSQVEKAQGRTPGPPTAPAKERAPRD
jgi:hypothetical protein